MEHVNLLGAEDVRRASNNIQNAAQSMVQAANLIETSLRDHTINADHRINRLEELVNRLDKLLEALEAPDSTLLDNSDPNDSERFNKKPDI